VFFSDLLPMLATNPAAVGVALYALNVLSRKKGYPRYTSAGELKSEPGLVAFLASVGTTGDAFELGLADVVGLNVLLPLTIERDGELERLYFLNSAADRRGMDAVRAGAVDLGPIVREPAPAASRSTVFALYESLIGTVTPLVADELADAERRFPAEWIEAAFREAAAQNARSWRYVTRILERWATEGPDYATTERDSAGQSDRYFTGKYGRILKQRLKS
jgi:DnaD/phage-associated family protein